MTMTDATKRSRTARTAFWRRLARQTALGAAGAVGSGTVSVLVWWLRGG
ncbi:MULTISPECIES: hypothetical protein [unclassified Streptomyces]|nr:MULTISPECIES: hypothetical protein [unclassified Streptomyces]QHC30743.1 hypothetical protein GR129_20115 [Streptomyces sp. HF10]WKE70334.1 hypothetical protein QHG49_15430 [Streptomyces sp. WP-1]